MSDIVYNLDEVHNKIKNACIKSGRNENEVTLICVSKTKPIEDLFVAYDNGERLFGENKVQEIIDKYDKLPKDATFHMIGHLQTNKVKQVLPKTCLIHSVDSYHLAKEISKHAYNLNTNADILIEVNIGNEDTKYGVSFDKVEELIKQISLLTNIRIKGLMTVAPYVENPEDNRVFFKKMKQLYVDLKAKNIDNVDMEVLSMGMTGDYEVAIEEGATMIRVGTGIFGARQYNK